MGLGYVYKGSRKGSWIVPIDSYFIFCLFALLIICYINMSKGISLRFKKEIYNLRILYQEFAFIFFLHCKGGI